MAQEQELLFSLHYRMNLLPHKSEDREQAADMNIHSTLAEDILNAKGIEYGSD
jgi:hypothetical protein